MYPAAVSSDAYGPLYSRIAMLMRQRILGGQWEAGAQIPTIEGLMSEFGASRVTIRLALDMLERDGLIERFRGRGTFVTDRGKGLHRIKLGQSWHTLVEALEGTRPRLLETIDDALPPGGEGLGCDLAESYCRLKRVHVRDNVAFAVMYVHLDQRWYQRAADRFNHELIIPVLRSLKGLKIGHAHQSLSIGCAEPEVAAHLGVPIGVPVGMLRRVICDEDGVAVYVGDFTYRGDLIRMDVDLILPEDGDG
ncbi:MAG: GntR family transcriptional regulator [Alphaproteobacteria bacterium]|nr:GntR family transcriptional regulator [Alphaproteobacteria bacterium]